MHKPDPRPTFVVFGRVLDANERVIASAQRRLQADDAVDACERARGTADFAGHDVYASRLAGDSDRQAWIR